MNMADTSNLRHNVKKIIAAALLAIAVTTTPLFMDSMLGTEMTSLAVAGRPQSGGGEY